MNRMDGEADILFEVSTPMAFKVRVTRSYWNLITEIKHPVMSGRVEAVMEALKEPDEVRQSRSDSSVYLFYRLEKPGRWLCAVARRLNGQGFLITAYPTDNIKEGERIWTR